ncbi:MAG TPA: hypothetical protein VGG29_04310 [Caulobacteraceae bacterium]|jgi:hypothetical protein
MIPALILAATLMTAAPDDAAAGGNVGEPLPAGAPTDSYELAAWCYGALDQYLNIYEKVIPDLKDIDRMFGTSVKEAKPYSSDMAAARVELKLIGAAVTAAEKASPEPITGRGAAAISQGRNVWSLAQAKTERELARAWLGWALPDACDTNARALTKRSLLLGASLRYNAGQAPPPAEDAAPHDAAPQDAGPQDSGPPAADAPQAAPSPTPDKPQVDTIDSFLAKQNSGAAAASDGNGDPAPPKADDGAPPPQP